MSRTEIMEARERLQASRASERNITVVIGPPCSGKTTYVAANFGPNDVVIDFDLLAVAFGSMQPWNHSQPHVRMAQAARAAAIGHALGDPQSDHTVWVILTDRQQATHFALAGARTIVMDTPLDECERRAIAQSRTPEVIEIIRSYRS